ncbi:glycine cleavage system protein GcvH [Salinirussus salinus]|jgi:glycine cleavage system H protein|uniref:glycine cleavage system protein GcvH n=1 Tax=Salinirussus salinus TaxID=1198300 RepID=UPI00135BDFB0|nr:glycine cleavage system protein GcvH [Salinirussus salinus]
MSFEVPEDCRYLESHEWARPENGTVRVGISDFAQDELGDVVFVELPDEGDQIEREEAFGVVESIKAVSDIYAPVAGTVVEVNDALVNEPELVNEDPYGEGWMVAVEPEGDLEGLLSPAEYREQTE